jgi:hypothetical protein
MRATYFRPQAPTSEGRIVYVSLACLAVFVWLVASLIVAGVQDVPAVLWPLCLAPWLHRDPSRAVLCLQLVAGVFAVALLLLRARTQQRSWTYGSGTLVDVHLTDGTLRIGNESYAARFLQGALAVSLGEGQGGLVALSPSLRTPSHLLLVQDQVDGAELVGELAPRSRRLCIPVNIGRYSRVARLALGAGLLGSVVCVGALIQRDIDGDSLRILEDAIAFLALLCYRPRRSVGIGEHRAAWCAAWRAITSWGYV